MKLINRVLPFCLALAFCVPSHVFASDKLSIEDQKLMTQMQEEDDADFQLKNILATKENNKSSIAQFSTQSASIEQSSVVDFPSSENLEKILNPKVETTEIDASESSFVRNSLKRITLQNGKAFVAHVNDFAIETTNKASNLLINAISFLGVPYKFGGESAAQGFDCSGFVKHVFQTAMGFTLPRQSQDQAKDPNLQVVAKTNLAPGDLVFFNTRKAVNSHVGVYVGNMTFIHAPSTGKSIKIESMDTNYWQSRFTGARRLVK